jgi:hypothetical protein
MVEQLCLATTFGWDDLLHLLGTAQMSKAVSSGLIIGHERTCSQSKPTDAIDPQETFNGTLIDHEVGNVEDAQRIVTASVSNFVGCVPTGVLRGRPKMN